MTLAEAYAELSRTVRELSRPDLTFAEWKAATERIAALDVDEPERFNTESLAHLNPRLNAPRPDPE